MPMRFTTPSLGGRGQQFLEAHHWEFAVAYRRLDADKWFIGTKVVTFDTLPLLGQPMFVKVNSIDVTVTYGVTRRLSLALNLPFSSGSHSRFYGDSARHTVSASGLGDVNVLGNFWLRDPLDHPNGNLALGLGVKAPTGRHNVMRGFWTATGTGLAPADQSVQPGDGGWGIMLQTQGFRRLANRTYGYLGGNYLMSPREKTEVPFRSTFVAVTDVYSARLGIAYSLWPEQGVSVSLGGRIDGTPAGDLIGGRDNAYRRPGSITYLEPGLAITRGAGTFRLNIPVRVYQHLGPDRSSARLDGGDLADRLIFASYSTRF
jgi:hypothetical protein